MAKIKVLEVDQWTAFGGEVEKFTMDNFDINEIFSGKDARRVTGITRHMILEVKDDQKTRPLIGKVWFITGPDGHLERYKENHDSSG